jgi:uncharacterized protein (DUF1330 family)
VFDLDIHDPDGYAAYRLDGQASIRRFGGRVLSGDPAPEGVVELLEGEWLTKRLVIAHRTSPPWPARPLQARVLET